MHPIVSLFIVISLVLSASVAFSGEVHDNAAEAEHVEEGTGSEQSEALFIHLRVPLFTPGFESTPVALVDEEPITVAELKAQIMSSHVGRKEAATSTSKNYLNLLERVISMKLIMQEARNIGLDELPEVAGQIEKYASELLIANLMTPMMDAIEADPEELDALYRKMSRELRLNALAFTREEDAQAFEADYDAQRDFEKLARSYVEAGRADGETDAREYVKLKDLHPQIARVAYEMEPGSASGIFSTPDGYLVFYLYDARFYEDEGVRDEARRMIREPLMKKAADEYVEELIARHSTVDRELLEDTDFEKKKSGFLFFRREEPVDIESLLEDDRVLATVHDEEPFEVTVGDLAKKIQERHFHGLDKAAEKGKLNPEKWRVLRDILFRRTAAIEARQKGVDRDERYVADVDRFSESLLFSTFIKKVVAPDVEIQEEAVRAHYDANIEDFSSPAMYRLNGLAFEGLADAKEALAKIRRGADYKWVSANSPGQLDREDQNASLFENKLLSLTAMPDALHRLVEGQGEGAVVLYSAPGGPHYVISIDHVYPSEPEPYEKARMEIAKIIFDEELKKLVDHWAAELRDAYDTRVFIADEVD